MPGPPKEANLVDKEVLLTNAITVLRVPKNNNIGGTSFYCLLEITQMQINNKFEAKGPKKTFTNIGDRWKELEISIFSETSALEKVSKYVANILQNNLVSPLRGPSQLRV